MPWISDAKLTVSHNAGGNHQTPTTDYLFDFWLHLWANMLRHVHCPSHARATAKSSITPNTRARHNFQIILRDGSTCNLYTAPIFIFYPFLKINSEIICTICRSMASYRRTYNNNREETIYYIQFINAGIFCNSPLVHYNH